MTEKTQIFNLVILDKSGSMSRLKQSAIDGFNETLAGIKSAQEKYADTQQHFVSLVSFCGCSTTYIYDKVTASNADPIKDSDYQPCCQTPLYDAMGEAITNMRDYVKQIDDSTILVTIITDGNENASKHYNRASIRALVQELEKDGWNFTYMGANQDSVLAGHDVGISQVRNFAAVPQGMSAAYQQDKRQRSTFFESVHRMRSAASAAPRSAASRRAAYSDLARSAYMSTEQSTSASQLQYVNSPFSPAPSQPPPTSPQSPPSKFRRRALPHPPFHRQPLHNTSPPPTFQQLPSHISPPTSAAPPPPTVAPPSPPTTTEPPAQPAAATQPPATVAPSAPAETTSPA